MHTLSIKQMSDGLRAKKFSSRELTQHFLKRIETYDGRLNSYITVTAGQALAQADAADAMLIKGQSGPLTGVPLAQKDIFCTTGVRTSCASRMLDTFIAPYDAHIVQKLHDEAGMVMLGKCNMDEFAMGSSNETSWYGPVRNPWDLERVPGGSSGGSAAAVAADQCLYALGTDTGGSIRQPAALCGVVGLKPTYGRVSRHGLIAMASSFDQIGPLTKTVEDAALVLNEICGHDNLDSTTSKNNVPDFTENLSKDIKGLRVGVPREFFRDGLSPEVSERIMSAISKMEDLGCEIVDISLPNFEYALAVYYIIVPSEVSANLARYDGIRYGYSSKSKTLVDTYFESRTSGLGLEPKRRIMIGAYALSSGYYDAYYLKAQKIRRLIKNDFDSAFDPATTGVDLIVGPVSPTTAFKVGEKSSDPLALYLEDIYTVPVNLVGLPGISIPCGNGRESGLPVGFQIIGRPFDEKTVLKAAYQLEKTLR